MLQHPPIWACALSSPDGVCSPFISGCAKIKRCKKCGFWNIVGVNTSRAVPGGCGQARGAPASSGLGHLPGAAPWGEGDTAAPLMSPSWGRVPKVGPSALPLRCPTRWQCCQRSRGCCPPWCCLSSHSCPPVRPVPVHGGCRGRQRGRSPRRVAQGWEEASQGIIVGHLCQAEGRGPGPQPGAWPGAGSIRQRVQTQHKVEPGRQGLAAAPLWPRK